MTYGPGTSEHPLSLQVADLLGNSPIPASRWKEGKLTSGGYLIMIEGAGSISLSYADPKQTTDWRRSQLAQLIPVLQGHYGNDPLEIQESLWRVEIDSSRLESSQPTIIVRLHCIRSL